MSSLPLKEKSAEGSKIESLAAMVKGFLPKISLDDFPVEPEKACEKLPLFLPCWLKRFGKISKPDARAAFKIAAPKLGTAERDSIIEHLITYRKFLVKKQANLESGERTDVHVLSVLKQMESMQQGAPSKRLRIKTPEKKVPRQPEKASSSEQFQSEKASSSSGQPEKAAASKAKILIAADTESSWSAAESLQTDVEMVEISSTSSGAISSKEMKACKRPSMYKKPAGPLMKKPGKAGKAVKMATHNSWVASCSFGWLKMTKASHKAYIQARDGLDSKVYCLVNVSLSKGDDQDRVMQELMDEAGKPGWTKEKLVEFKNSLLKRLS